MIYEDIFGWFDYSYVWDYAIEKAPSDRQSVFVEIGAYLGRSVAYCAEKIKESGKPIKLYAIDIWESYDEIGDLHNRTDEIKQDFDKHIFHVFLNNIKDLKDYITPLRLESSLAVNYFDNETFDCIYIDARHAYESVKEDLNLWYPKLKSGGILAGHDYNMAEGSNWSGVKRAVDEFAESHNLDIEHQGKKKTFNEYGWGFFTTK